MKTKKTQQEAFRLLNAAKKELIELIEESEYSETVPVQHLVEEIKSFLSKNDETQEVYQDCADFIAFIDNTTVPFNNKKSLPETENIIDNEECPMNNLIDRLKIQYPKIYNKLDLNIDFGDKVPNIFQQYSRAFFNEYKAVLNVWYSKNDTFYYILEHKGNVYNSNEMGFNFEFEMTAQMACIEKSFEICNKKIFDSENR
ncbi:MAG: hypothetical protein RIR01_1953 [Bacteroidota bacterium]|jgi:hypothetical protein